VLRDRLAANGARVEVETLEDGHELGLTDIEVARRWLAYVP
jgi:phospholipase/carboxylesterase